MKIILTEEEMLYLLGKVMNLDGELITLYRNEDSDYTIILKTEEELK